MGIAIEASPDRPGHVGHTPTPGVNLGLSAGRLHDYNGGLFGSAIVRALTGRPEAAGTLGALPMQEYAAQVFGIPGGMRPGDPKRVPSASEAAAAHAHTLLAMEVAAIELGRSGRTNSQVPQGLADALDAAQTWKAPR